MFGIIGFAIGGIILFCLGRSGAPTQPHEIATADKPQVSPENSSQIQAAPSTSSVASTGMRPIVAARTNDRIAMSVAAGSIYATYVSTVLPQTKRFQGLS